MARDFTSTPREPAEGQQEQQPIPEFTFTLDGQQFTATLGTDADALLEWSELAAVAEDGQVDMESAAGVAFTARFFKMMLPGQEYSRFRAHLRVHKTPADTLLEIMQAINEEMQAAVEDETGRPTQPPSRSSHGRGERDARTLQIMSLAASDGEVVMVPPAPPRPPRGGRPPQQQRRGGQRRRRAG
jgi:hypothetical protein